MYLDIYWNCLLLQSFSNQWLAFFKTLENNLFINLKF